MRLRQALRVGVSGEVGVQQWRGKHSSWPIHACALSQRARHRAHVRVALPTHQALIQTMYVSASLNEAQHDAAITLQLSQQQIAVEHVVFDYQRDPLDAKRIMVIVAYRSDIASLIALLKAHAMSVACVEPENHAMLRYAQSQAFEAGAVLVGQQGARISLFTPAPWPHGLTVQHCSQAMLRERLAQEDSPLYLFSGTDIAEPLPLLKVHRVEASIDEAIATGLVLAP